MMTSIQGQMHGVWSAVAAATGGAGAAVMFLGARRNDGVSELARNFAVLSASRAARSVWLLDLDFFSDGQFNALGGKSGRLQGPFDMTFGRTPFWRAAPRAPDGSQGEGAVVGYRSTNPKLFVSRFNKSSLTSQQKLQVAPARDYWRAVRAAVDMTIVDAPALEQSRAGLALVADMDGVVLVVDNDHGDVRDAIEMRDEVLGRGGRCLGIIVSGLGGKPKKSLLARFKTPAESQAEM
jgi:Mrp family chromosome partitioning ATPase